MEYKLLEKRSPPRFFFLTGASSSKCVWGGCGLVLDNVFDVLKTDA